MKCRNLICGIIAGIPLELYKKSTGEQLGSPVWLEQPDERQPRAVTMAYTIQSLLMNSVAYWEVTAVYSDDGRPARFAWVANERVTARYNKRSTEIIGYAVDGAERPMNGVSSLITFQSPIDGILHAGARILRAAIDLEKAAANAAAAQALHRHRESPKRDLSQPQSAMTRVVCWTTL